MTVYFLTRNADPQKLIKIGWSDSFRRRLNDYRHHNPEGITVLASVEADKVHERHLKAVFSGSNVDGEWFRATEDLLTFIEAVRSRGMAAFPEQLLGGSVKRSEASGAALAKRLCLAIIYPQQGRTLMESMRVCAELSGLSFRRVKSIMYDEPIAVLFDEIEKLRDAVGTHSVDPAAVELLLEAAQKDALRVADLQKRLAAMLARTDADFHGPEIAARRSIARGVDRAGNSGGAA